MSCQLLAARNYTDPSMEGLTNAEICSMPMLNIGKTDWSSNDKHHKARQEYNKAYREKNKEKIRAKAKEYYQKKKKEREHQPDKKIPE